MRIVIFIVTILLLIGLIGMTMPVKAETMDLYPPVEKDVVVFETNDTFFFGFDMHDLENEQATLAETRLDEIAQFLTDNPDKMLRIEGHTDEVGTRTYNYGLSHRRINYIMAGLLQRGVCLDQFYGVKYEELEPVADGHSDDAWQANRNVFLAIHDKREMGIESPIPTCNH